MTRTKNTQEARESGLFLYQSAKVFLNNALDLIFPPRCQFCGRVDTHFCERCTRDLAQIPIETISQNMPPLVDILSSGVHRDLLQASVQALKYQRQQHLGVILAERLVPIIEAKQWMIDMVLPVPIHAKRLKQRGYNQAKEISLPMATALDLAHRDDLLIRPSQTQSQVGLSRAERLDNVAGDFKLTEASSVTEKTILLVDDVRTTGATMATCADILLNAGATKVYGVTVTIAELSN
ncbi:MAG: ComF family protein [Chloroflexota bacterium]